GRACRVVDGPGVPAPVAVHRLARSSRTAVVGGRSPAGHVLPASWLPFALLTAQCGQSTMADDDLQSGHRAQMRFAEKVSTGAPGKGTPGDTDLAAPTFGLPQGGEMSRKKLSRNDPCPCGSGKKYKHCCYGKGVEDDLGLESGGRQPQYPI